MPVNGENGHAHPGGGGGRDPERTSSRPTQAQRSSATRRAQPAAARRLFGRHGSAATGREQIVEEAGVTRGALYHHVDSKEGLFRALYEELEGEIVDTVARAAAASAEPVEQLRLG